MKQIILNVLFIVSVFSKGPCDERAECYGRVFELGDRALCVGFRGCYKAEFGTDNNPICSGAEACAFSKVTYAPPKMLCNGFHACYGVKKGIQATEKIACNGLKSCREVVGSLTAPQVTCDGDIACNNKKIVATGAPPAGEKNDISCNGNKACVGSNLISDGTVNCDGDISCKNARIEANKVGCHGKRGCYGAKIFGAATVYGYGFNAANAAQIVGPDQGKKSKGKWTFEVRALGFNSLLGSTINTRGARSTILGYGYRSLVGAEIKCMGGSVCTVVCRMNACKNADIFVDKRATILIDPQECDPRHPDWKPSKKNAAKPGKQKGIHCPVIRGPGLKGPMPIPGADIDIIEGVEEGIDELADQVKEAWMQTADYLEMVESAERAEIALDAMINERIAVFEDNLDLTSLPLDDEEEEFMVVNHMISNNNKSNILTSNLLTALIVFIVTSVGSLCYIAYRFGGSAETKALLQ